MPLSQQRFDHASLQTTTGYLRRIVLVKLVEQMNQRTWEVRRGRVSP